MNTSAPWEIVLAGPARESLKGIRSPDRERVEAALKAMAADPFRGDVKLLQGNQGDSAAASAPGVFSFLESRMRGAS
jgi:hypothetical protein